MIEEQLTIRQRMILLIVVIVIILFAGLNPQDYDFRNNVSLSADKSGLEFERYGVAFTKPFIVQDLDNVSASSGFTMTLMLGPEPDVQDGFALIAQIYSGDDESQLVIGRWQDQLIVMNGDDYDNRLGSPRISGRSDPSRTEVRLVAVTSSPRGTRLYVDGRMVNERPDLVLHIPKDPPGGRIILGNSVAGTHQWRGVIRDFALYDRVLLADEINAQFAPGMDKGSSSPAKVDGVLVHFVMAEFARGIVPTPASGGIHLEIPKRMVVVEKRFFKHPFTHRFELNLSFVIDFVVNLFGFIPFGAAVSILFAGLGSGFEGFELVPIVIVAAAVLSGGIEMVQAWLPSRTSSSLDLALNILGACAGVLIVVFRHNVAAKRPGSAPPGS